MDPAYEPLTFGELFDDCLECKECYTVYTRKELVGSPACENCGSEDGYQGVQYHGVTY